MNMLARLYENPAMTFKILRKQNVTEDGLTDGQRENSIPTTNKVYGEYSNIVTRGLARNQKMK